MKKYIRDLLDDLTKNALTKKQDPPPAPVVPDDLNNQELSKNPEERVRQLDYQAQEDEERETLE